MKKNKWNFLKHLNSLINPGLSEEEKAYEKFVTLLSQARYWSATKNPREEQGLLKLLKVAIDGKIIKLLELEIHNDNLKKAEENLTKQSEEYLKNLAEPRVKFVIKDLPVATQIPTELLKMTYKDKVEVDEIMRKAKEDKMPPAHNTEK